MKALVKVGYGCNEHCSFCHTQDVRHVDASGAEVERNIRRAASLGHTMVVLSGGEPTIRPELMRWAELVAELGLSLGLVTNGLMLAYHEVLERLLRRRLRYVYMSLHGGDARVHDSLVRRASFSTALQAIDNLVGRDLELTVNCVVTRQNVDHLHELVDRMAGYSGLTLKFSMVEPKGGAAHLFDRLVPDVAVAAERVRAAILYGMDRTGGGIRLAHGGFPLCLMPGLESDYDDLRTHGYWTMIEAGEPDFFVVDDLAKTKPAATCRDCRLRGPCPGLYRTYHERRGPSALSPRIDGTRSNAFDWVFEAVMTDRFDPGDGCPLLEIGVTPWDRGRHLLVRNGAKIARYRADTRDFDDEDIGRTKHDVGQVYLDASRKPAPDDFAADLVKLARSPICHGCAHHDACTGLFEPQWEDVFGRDDARVVAIIERLVGDVLDVGCGEGRYLETFRAATEAGTLSYRGLEPDIDAVRRLRRRWPEVSVECLEAEAWLADATSVDHVLVLRSWNHLRDPDRVLQVVRHALRPGGTLTVVDNVVFGLARMPAQVGLARRGPTGFEHRRNDDAAAAHRRIAQAGFVLLERRDVSPATSNQWLLRYALAH